MSARRPFQSEQDGPLLSAFVDGELETDDRAMVEAWLAEDVQVREEVDRLVRLKAFTDHLVLREAPREDWEDFHDKVYNRSERGLGWMLLLIGIAVVGGFGLLRLTVILLAAAIPVVVRLGVLLAGAGLLVILISVLRERLFTRKRDRYDDVVR